MGKACPNPDAPLIAVTTSSAFTFPQPRHRFNHNTMSTTTIDMSWNAPYVALPKLRMQCGLHPTLGDTSYPEKGKKKSQKGNAKRRMHRRNAANKGAKAQDQAGSPQAAEEPPKTGKQYLISQDSKTCEITWGTNT